MASHRASGVVFSCAAVVLLAAAVMIARGSQDDSHELVMACRGALWKKTFDDATAAGLNPGAIVIAFTADTATRRHEGGEFVMAGVEAYRPTTDIAAFPVRYECRIDAATKTVRSVSYAAIDANGVDLPRAPTDLVKDRRMLEACIDRLEEGLEDDVRKRGISGPLATVEITPADAEFVPRAGTVEIQGRGRAKYAEGFDWQLLIFQCRYDTKKAAVTRETHALETPSPGGALPTETRAAIEACRMAVGSEVLADARGRGYRRLERVEIELPDLANVTSRGAYLDVAGKGQFRLDPRHAQPTPLTFACVVDPGSARVMSARFDVAAGSWTPSGDVANGPTGSLRCGSRTLPRQECGAAIRGNVRIIREFGHARCEAYRNWMWSTSQIVVWDGCAAEFEYDAR